MQSLPCESIWKVLANNPYLPEKAMVHDAITFMWKYSKKHFLMTPISYYYQKGNGTWYHHSHVKVLKKCFPMIPISYITKKGNVLTYTFPSWHVQTSLPLPKIAIGLCVGRNVIIWYILVKLNDYIIIFTGFPWKWFIIKSLIFRVNLLSPFLHPSWVLVVSQCLVCLCFLPFFWIFVHHLLKDTNGSLQSQQIGLQFISLNFHKAFII